MNINSCFICHSSLCFDIVERLLWKSVNKPFVAEKILHSRPDVANYTKEQLMKTTYKDALRLKRIGLLYPLWKITGETPPLEMLHDAAILNLPDVIAIFETHFLHLYKRILYDWAIEKCIALSISFQNLDILKYIVTRRNLKSEYFMERQHSFDIFVYSSEDVIDYMYNDVGVKPSPSTFYQMMSLNTDVNFVPYIPKEIPVKVVMIAYGMFHDREKVLINNEIMTELDKLCNQEYEEGKSVKLTTEERAICRQYCEIPMWEFETENDDDEHDEHVHCHDDINVHDNVPIWKVLRYLWGWFQSYPSNYDLQGCFADVIDSKDLDGLRFLVEDLGFTPSEPYMFYDEG